MNDKWAALAYEQRPWSSADDFLHLLQFNRDGDYPKYFIVRFNQMSAEQDEVQVYYRLDFQRLELTLAQKISALCNELKAKEVTVAEASSLYESAQQQLIKVS